MCDQVKTLDETPLFQKHTYQSEFERKKTGQHISQQKEAVFS